MSFSQKLVVWIVRCYYCQTQKTANTWKISGMLIVYWPITIKFRIREQTSKPQPNYRCCLRFSCLTPYWLISRNTITFHQYFGVHGFVSFMGSCWRHLWIPETIVHPVLNILTYVPVELWRMIQKNFSFVYSVSKCLPSFRW